MDDWNLIRQTYRELFKIPVIVVDYMAVSPILQLLSRGYSNKRIARELEEDEEKIRATIDEFLEFDGFEEDLDFDPTYFYDRYRYNRYRYVSEVTRISPATSKADIIISYQVNERLDRMERKINYYVK